MAKIELNEEEIAKVISSLIGRLENLNKQITQMELWGTRDIPIFGKHYRDYELLKAKFEHLLVKERETRSTEHIS